MNLVNKSEFHQATTWSNLSRNSSEGRIDQANVLIVDDDPDIQESVSSILETDEIKSVTVGNGDEMRQKITESHFDLVILDLVLPGEDGLTLARELLARSNIPILMLTGKCDIIDKIIGIEMGADDYITKPFHARELLARVKSILRRRHPYSTHTPEIHGNNIEFSGWILDLDARKLNDPNGENAKLTTYEFQVLAELVKRPNRALSRDQILDYVADKEWDPFDRSIDVLIGKIRRKLKDNPRDPSFIKTLRNFGYMFVGKSEKSLLANQQSNFSSQKKSKTKSK